MSFFKDYYRFPTSLFRFNCSVDQVRESSLSRSFSDCNHVRAIYLSDACTVMYLSYCSRAKYFCFHSARALNLSWAIRSIRETSRPRCCALQVMSETLSSRTLYCESFYLLFIYCVLRNFLSDSFTVVDFANLFDSSS